MPLCGVLFAPHPPILLPEIGGGEEKKAAKTLAGFAELNAAAEKLAPDAVLCLTSHGPMFGDSLCLLDYPEYAGGLEPFGLFGGPAWPKDAALLALLEKAFQRAEIPCLRMDAEAAARYGQSARLDHGAAVPLRLLPALAGKPLVCLAPGFLPARTLYAAGKAVAAALKEEDLRLLVLASGDLAHNHPGGNYPEDSAGPRFDRKLEELLSRGAVEAILSLDAGFLEAAAQCCYQPFVMALGTVDGLKAAFAVYSREAPWGVGYLTASALPRSLSEPDPVLRLARAAVTHYVQTGHDLDWESVRESLTPAFAWRAENEQRAVFVSLHKGEALRGCIGTLFPSQDNLAAEILFCAREAAGSDPRFSPVTPDELEALTVSVDILGEPEQVGSFDDLDEKRYGVIVRSGRKTGVLLPDLEGVNSVAEQVDIARRKAFIYPDEPIELFRFTVERHE